MEVSTQATLAELLQAQTWPLEGTRKTSFLRRKKKIVFFVQEIYKMLEYIIGLVIMLYSYDVISTKE